MKLQTVPRQSAVDAVVDQLRESIEQGRLLPGDRLPTELELVEQLGVSRTVLREAITRLETIGLLTVQRGRGMFIGDRQTLSNCVQLVRSAMAFSPRDLLQFTEFRRAMECYAARRAAEIASPEQLAELTAACDSIDLPNQDDFACMQADLRFHLTILESTGNELMRNVLEVVQEFTLAAMVQTTPRPRDREESRQRHGRILDAIRRRKPEAAEAAMNAHFDRTVERLRQCEQK